MVAPGIWATAKESRASSNRTAGWHSTANALPPLITVWFPRRSGPRQPTMYSRPLRFCVSALRNWKHRPARIVLLGRSAVANLRRQWLTRRQFGICGSHCAYAPADMKLGWDSSEHHHSSTNGKYVQQFLGDTHNRPGAYEAPAALCSSARAPRPRCSFTATGHDRSGRPEEMMAESWLPSACRTRSFCSLGPTHGFDLIQLRQPGAKSPVRHGMFLSVVTDDSVFGECCDMVGNRGDDDGSNKKMVSLLTRPFGWIRLELDGDHLVNRAAKDGIRSLIRSRCCSIRRTWARNRKIRDVSMMSRGFDVAERVGNLLMEGHCERAPATRVRARLSHRGTGVYTLPLDGIGFAFLGGAGSS